MNVSTSGIGVNNNVLQGEDLAGDTAGTINSFDSGAFDESFVINPEPLASEVKVFVSKTAGGFAASSAAARLPPKPTTCTTTSTTSSETAPDRFWSSLPDPDG